MLHCRKGALCATALGACIPGKKVFKANIMKIKEKSPKARAISEGESASKGFLLWRDGSEVARLHRM